MIDSLITIIIPCQNSVEELKSTLYSISSQTKIKGTRIIMLNNVSTDGIYQYCNQAVIDYKKILNINPVYTKDGKFPVFVRELNSYLIWISPGTTFDSADGIMKIVNNIKKGIDFYIYKRKDIIPFSNIIDKIKIRRGNIQIECLVCKREDLSLVEYFREDGKISFKPLKDPNTKKIIIFRENILPLKKIKEHQPN